MKKFLPFIILTLAFTGFLAIQVAVDQSQTKANQSNTQKDTNVRFENLYKTMTFTSTDKKSFKLGELKTPIVILNFWASWCVPCMKELPSLVDLKKQFGDNISIIGINSDEDDQEKMIKKIVDKYKINFPTVAEKDSKISDEFYVSAIPFTLIYINGSVYLSKKGSMDFLDQSLIDHFKTVLKK
jgi:cytochrome c biogenesis protein CcmG/thiol:disulfide interchange protein DsbE